MKKTLIISGAGDIAKSIDIHLSVTSETISTTKSLWIYHRREYRKVFR